MTLVGREATQPDRLRIVPRDTAAQVVHRREVFLRLCVALVGRETIPPSRLGLVPAKRRGRWRA